MSQKSSTYLRETSRPARNSTEKTRKENFVRREKLCVHLFFSKLYYKETMTIMNTITTLVALNLPMAFADVDVTCGSVKTAFEAGACCGEDQKEATTVADLYGIKGDVQNIHDPRYSTTETPDEYGAWLGSFTLDDLHTETTLRDKVFDAHMYNLAREPTVEEYSTWTARMLANKAHEGSNDMDRELILSDEWDTAHGVTKPPSEDLTGRSYVVTGMSSGFGFLTAVELAVRGATVCGFARTRNVFDASIESARMAHKYDNVPHQNYLGRVGVADDVLARIKFREVDGRDYDAVKQFFETDLKQDCDVTNLAGMFLNHGTVGFMQFPPYLSFDKNTYESLESDIAATPTRFSAQTTYGQNNAINSKVWSYFWCVNFAMPLLNASSATDKSLLLTSSVSSIQPDDREPYPLTNKLLNAWVPTLQRWIPNLRVNTILPARHMTDLLFALPRIALPSFQNETKYGDQPINAWAALGRTPAGTSADPIPLLITRFWTVNGVGKLICEANDAEGRIISTYCYSTGTDILPVTRDTVYLARKEGARKGDDRRQQQSPMTIAKMSAYALIDPKYNGQWMLSFNGRSSMSVGSSYILDADGAPLPTNFDPWKSMDVPAPGQTTFVAANEEERRAQGMLYSGCDPAAPTNLERPYGGKVGTSLYIF